MRRPSQRSTVTGWVHAAVACSLLAAVFVGCRGGYEVSNMPEEGADADQSPDRVAAPDVGVDTGGLFAGAPDTEAHRRTGETDREGKGAIASPASSEVRSRRRMDIDQLDASLRRVTGGIGWQRYGDNAFEEFSATLGKPDYADSVKEDLSMNPVFQKFLGDAARHVCSRLAAREKGWAEEGTNPERRRLLIAVDHEDTHESSPEAVEKNIRELLLNFHGRRVAPGSAAQNNWVELFRRSNREADTPVEAWKTVCVALVQHPDFYTY